MGLQWIYPTEMTMPGWEMPIIFFINYLRFIAKGSRKARERCAKDVSTRAMSCPKFAQLFVSARKMKAQALLQGKRSNISQWHVGCFHIHSYRQQHIYCIVCNRICLIPNIFDSWYEFSTLENVTLMGPRKSRERFAKGGFLGAFI